MPIPDIVLDYLADRYRTASVQMPFVTWAAIEAKRLGWKI